jgi:hypothetical protein
MIGSGFCFMSLLNSFTESWGGILRPLTERQRVDHGGPEPFSQNPP